MKLAVVGLDSADWTLLDRWLHHLPNIAMIRREGVSGPLTTCKPPVTIPAWKCYATGMNPGKLGIYWFASPNFERRSLDLNVPGDLPGNFWDYLPRALVVNTPGTFPPRAIDGVMIAGFPCPDGQPFATPPWILPRLNGYRVNTRASPGDPEFPQQAIELMRTQLETFERLAPRFRFGQVTMFHIDELHHLHGSDTIVLEAWRMIDEGIGRILDLAENVMLVSDHGSGPMEGYVNVVPSLETAGLLSLRKDPLRAPIAGALRLAQVVPPSLRGGLVSRLVPAKVKDAIRTHVGPLVEYLPAASAQLHQRIDWTSPVIPLNQGLFYRNPRSRRAASLQEIQDCVGKMRGIARVWTREEIYAGSHVDLAPDLWVEAKPGIELVARFGEPWEWKASERGHGWIVNHRQNGIFGFYGEDVEGTPVDHAQIYDMCPTVLSFFDTPPPPNVDGRVLPVRRRAGGARVRDLPGALGVAG